MGLFSFLSNGPSLGSLIRKGALIVDVRTPNEFDRGRIPDAINIPVDRVVADPARLLAIKRPVIFCCTDGHRSRQAIAAMKKAGKKDVYYAGDWERLYETWKREN